MPPRRRRTGDAARASKRWSQSSWRHRSCRCRSRTPARQPPAPPSAAMQARRPAYSLRALLHVLDDDAVHHVGDVIEAIDDFLEMVINLIADEEVEPAATGSTGAEQLVQAFVVHLVSFAFQCRNLRGEVADVAGFGAD